MQTKPDLIVQPLVSIIIPTFNRAHLLGETLDSVLAQTYRNWECIVVDDGSSDYIVELLEFYSEKDARIHFYNRPDSLPKGANDCRNFGFLKSRGDYVNWFDSDDVMLESFIESKVNSLQSSDNFVVCSGYYTDENLEIKSKMGMDVKCDLYKGLVLWKNHIITNSVLFRRSFLENKKLFLSKISRGQEAEFYSRLFFLIPQNSFKIINEPLFLYRQHEVATTYLNKFYIKKNKISESYIGTENLKRAIQLNDITLIDYLYKDLLVLFFLGVENAHFSNSWFILRNLIRQIWKFDKNLGLELMMLIFFPLIFKKRSYTIERRLRLYKFV